MCSLIPVAGTRGAIRNAAISAKAGRRGASRMAPIIVAVGRRIAIAAGEMVLIITADKTRIKIEEWLEERKKKKDNEKGGRNGKDNN